ncbi:MAG: HAD superfamily (subfamily IIIA) phosphatase [Bacillota bacterium]|nr:MAG: HAD superfamily (subfamily IIIA) phosphatase [Bacillota bacterium]
MLRKLLPDLYVESIYHIDFEKLKAKGIDTIVTDLDNTLVPWSETRVNQQLLDWLEQLRGKGFKVCLLSNAVESRIASFRGAMSIPGFSKAYKPLSGAFKQALALLGSEAKHTAMIGDQIFTDVLGGNRMGLYTILVVPLSKQEFIGTRAVRLFERWFLRHLAPQK